MAVATTDYFITPDDGWTLVATNPVSLLIKPGIHHPWWVAVIASGTPSNDLIGVAMGRDSGRTRESFEADSITGLVFVRIKTPPASTPGSAMQFGVVTS